MIKLEHISKTFGDTGDGVHAVKDVSLEIGDGETVLGAVLFAGEHIGKLEAVAN